MTPLTPEERARIQKAREACATDGIDLDTVLASHGWYEVALATAKEDERVMVEEVHRLENRVKELEAVAGKAVDGIVLALEEALAEYKDMRRELRT